MLYFIIYLFIYYALSIKVKLPIQKLYEYNYSTKLYLKWFKGHLKKAFYHFDIYAGIVTIISFYVSFKWKVTLLIIAIILMIYDTENIKYNLMIDNEYAKVSKDKRIIRLLFVYIIIMFIPFLLGLIYRKYKVFYIGIGVVLLVLSYLIICLTNIFMLPIEFLIKKFVINNVFRKLRKLDIHFIGVMGRHGKSGLTNVLKQLLDHSVYIINNIDELYKINFNHNDYVIIKIKCLDNSIKDIYFNEILCTRSFDEEDLIILNKLSKKEIYFYKQNNLYKKLNHNDIYYYGDNDANINLIDYKLSNNKMKFTYEYHHKRYKDEINILGKYNLYHILLSILLLDNLNIMYKDKVSKLKNLNHSLEIKNLNGFTMIDDTYHSNLESFMEGLNILNNMKGIKIIVTPGLNDNIDIIGKNISEICDYIILIGEMNTKLLYDSLIKNSFNKANIYITNDIYESYALISNLNIKGRIYALYENNLKDLYKE